MFSIKNFSYLICNPENVRKHNTGLLLLNFHSRNVGKVLNGTMARRYRLVYVGFIARQVIYVIIWLKNTAYIRKEYGDICLNHCGQFDDKVLIITKAINYIYYIRKFQSPDPNKTSKNHLPSKTVKIDLHAFCFKKKQ